MANPYETEVKETITLRDVLEKRYSAEELVAQLTPEELASLCVGRICRDERGQSVIGAASFSVPGAAGETTDALTESREIPAVVLADVLRDFGLSRILSRMKREIIWAAGEI